jgi:hypothetical protein
MAWAGKKLLIDQTSTSPFVSRPPDKPYGRGVDESANVTSKPARPLPFHPLGQIPGHNPFRGTLPSVHSSSGTGQMCAAD